MGEFGQSSGEEKKDVDEGKTNQARREDRKSRKTRDSTHRRTKGSWDSSSVRGNESRSRRRRRSVETRSGRSGGSRGGQRARSGTSWAGREQVIIEGFLVGSRHILNSSNYICGKV